MPTLPISCKRNLIALFTIATLISLTGCQSSCEKYIGKRPECYNTKELILRDTTVIPQYKFDTIAITKKNDTILVVKERVKVTTIRNNDTITQYIEVPADTIYKEIIVPVTSPCYIIPTTPVLIGLGIFIVLACICILCRRR